MLRRRGTYTVNADPDSRNGKVKFINPTSFVLKQNGK